MTGAGGFHECVANTCTTDGVMVTIFDSTVLGARLQPLKKIRHTWKYSCKTKDGFYATIAFEGEDPKQWCADLIELRDNGIL